MSKLVGRYTLEELHLKELDGSRPLIENLLYERDSVLMVGKEKSNKTTFWLQACCALTSGEPFLGQYDVSRPVDCVYLQAEGKLASTKQCTERMTSVIPCNKTKLSILYYPSIPLSKEDGLAQVKLDIDGWRRPELIVIDPLYQCMTGDISSQADSSAMTASLRNLSEYYECSIVLIHHAHRPKRTESGVIMEEGDDSIFGSFVWKAWPDSVMLIEKVQGNKLYRKFSCNTQRMGNIIESIDMVLVEPNPFYLQLRGGQQVDQIILGIMNSEPLSITQLSTATGRDRHLISEALQRLIYQQKVVCVNSGKKPLLFLKK